MINNTYLIGVTGTNGKTSVTSFIAQISRHCGLPAAAIGQRIELDDTVLNRDLVSRKKGGLFRYFKKLSDDQNYKVISCEVYSAAIMRHAHVDIPYDIVVFTNLASDHQSVHGSSTLYRKQKLRFLNQLSPNTPVLIPPKASRLNEIIEASDKANLCPTIIADPYPFFSGPFEDAFMNENASLAVEVCKLIGLPTEKITEAVKQLTLPPGRMIRRKTKNGATIIIDFAHNPHGLKAVLQSIRKSTQGDIHLILSSKGGWGKSKRNEMGVVASKLADHVIIADDDPRHEDPAVIRAQLNVNRCFDEVPNRALAIKKAYSKLKSDDCLLIAGRGEDNYFVNTFGRMKFNDLQLVESLL
ncbi:MAG: glutamate ligase domain-containing protein [Cellvibrionaceae bacterium]